MHYQQPTSNAASKIIDGRPVSLYQYFILVLCGALIFMDGFDTQSISIATKAMSASLAIPLSRFGDVFSVLQFGGVIGTFLCGYLADKYGRRPVTIGLALCIAFSTIATAHVHTYSALMAVRFIGGIGLGGAFPCVLTLGSEYVKSTSRATIVAILFANYSLGAAAGAVFNGYIMANYDWTMVFVLDGGLSLISALLIIVWLPESPQFLLLRSRQATLLKIFRRFYPSEQIELQVDPVTAESSQKKAAKVPISSMFAKDRLFSTLILLGILLLSYATIKVMTVWLTPLLQNVGVSILQTSTVLASLNIGSMIGLGFSGYLIDRFGPVKALGPALAILTASVAVAAANMTDFSILVPCGFLIGMAGGIGQSAPLALFALIYPAGIRSTALAFGGGAGQVGKVLSPMLVGAFLANGWNGSSILYAVAILPAVGFAMMMAMKFSAGRSSIREPEYANQNHS
ncbi:MAG TPA: MFS transporter [Herbaspirillum sp.]|jgi:AAHS family 4-hydroxybenzoate transporter-like MFS transporter